MATRRERLRFLGVAAGYAAALIALLVWLPSSLDSPWFVVAAMICFLGLAFVARPLIPIRMPPPLRRIWPWEARGALYRRLGVTAAAVLIRQTPLRALNRHVYLTGGTRTLADVRSELEAAEGSHFWAAVLVAPYMLRLALDGAWLPLFWITLAQLAINAYPIMHLRLARARLDRLASRVNRRG